MGSCKKYFYMADRYTWLDKNQSLGPFLGNRYTGSSTYKSDYTGKPVYPRPPHNMPYIPPPRVPPLGPPYAPPYYKENFYASTYKANYSGDFAMVETHKFPPYLTTKPIYQGHLTIYKHKNF